MSYADHEPNVRSSISDVLVVVRSAGSTDVDALAAVMAARGGTVDDYADSAGRLMGDLDEVLTTADFSGGAYAMWGWLSDGLDGPPRYARGLTDAEIEDLMRLAAKEWLDLDLSSARVRRYLARWEDWPDSVRQPPGDAYL